MFHIIWSIDSTGTKNNLPRNVPDFITTTCLNWHRVLDEAWCKEVVIDSLRFLVNNGRARVFAFVIMPNHFHMIWQMQNDFIRQHVQRDLLKFTAQQILQTFKIESNPMLEHLRVNEKDRKYQLWERNSLNVPLYTDKFFFQKLNYIHNNPVRAGLCSAPEDYYYSSAAFYQWESTPFDFLERY